MVAMIRPMAAADLSALALRAAMLASQVAALGEMGPELARRLRGDPGRDSVGMEFSHPLRDVLADPVGFEGGLGPEADHLGLVFGDTHEYVYGKLVRIWIITCYKFDAAVAEILQDGRRSDQPVELGDDQGAVDLQCMLGGLPEFGTSLDIIMLSRFDFSIGFDQVSFRIGSVSFDGGVLALEPQSRGGLLLGRDPHQADEEWSLGLHGMPLSGCIHSMGLDV
jgi:hypothetical protein